MGVGETIGQDLMWGKYLSNAVNIAIIDDHQIFLDGVSLLIEGICSSYVVEQYNAPLDVLRHIQSGKTFDLLICDLIMNSMNGLALLSAMRSNTQTIPTLMLSGINTAPPVADVKRLGGNGFVHKSAKPAILRKAIQTVLAGEDFFDDGLGDSLADIVPARLDECGIDMSNGNVTPNLGPRQIEVLKLIANGDTNKAISETLCISENTVKTHLKQIFRKLGVNKRTACVRQAQMLGIV